MSSFIELHEKKQTVPNNGHERVMDQAKSQHKKGCNRRASIVLLQASQVPTNHREQTCSMQVK